MVRTQPVPISPPKGEDAGWTREKSWGKEQVEAKVWDMGLVGGGVCAGLGWKGWGVG